jgi:hypothetical protein
MLFCASILLLSIGFAVMTSEDASAATGPTRVQGDVHDTSGNHADGAQVFVEFLNKDTGLPRARTWSGTTDSAGYYQTTQWGTSDWEVGDTIRVTATISSEQEIETQLATNTFTQIVDVYFPTAIPQFGSLVGTLVAASAVCVVAVVLVRKRRVTS